MRKFVIAGLIAATLLPGVASAQTGELRRDRRDIREERRDVRDARREGDRGDVREERGELRDARREYREDWRDYRRSNSAVFRRPAYVAPVRGWRYRPVVVGYRFAPAYFASRYVIADPYRYRLPAPPRYNRWVRYANDVVLVDTRNGRVTSVYNGFFY